MLAVARKHVTDHVTRAANDDFVNSGPSTRTKYAYDEAGHLLGEYSSTGAMVEETVWLGDIPVATMRPHTGGGIDTYYVHTDHLNTPHLVTRPADNVQMWRWFPPTFGDSLPNQNPGGAGTFLYNLRFPGQIYDSQGGLFQNMQRDFDPAVGRYVESDPLGLGGGINTYEYVRSDPILAVDPLGLVKQGAGWSDPQWSAIKRAESLIRQELQKCSCQNGGSCIPCELAQRLLAKLNSSTVVEAGLVDPKTGEQSCGVGGIPGKVVFLSPLAFTKRCDCLTSTLYHELLHNTGLDHEASAAGPGVTGLEKKCMGTFCAAGTP